MRAISVKRRTQQLSAKCTDTKCDWHEDEISVSERSGAARHAIDTGHEVIETETVTRVISPAELSGMAH